MFKKKDFIDNRLLEVGISVDTNEWLFGVDISLQHPGTLILVGFGPFNFYIVVRGEH